MKKVAFVDIDGCLLIDGQLNPALVEKLKGYDQVILFTQRSKMVQLINLGLKASAHKEGEKVLTSDIRKALQEQLGKEIHLSSSVDSAMRREPMAYVQDIEAFETKLYPLLLKKADAAKELIPKEQGELERELERCHDEARDEAKRVAPPSAGYTSEELESRAHEFYPEGKQEQYKTLRQALVVANPLEEIQIDFFDDSEANAEEVKESLKNGDCTFIVGAGGYIEPLTTFQKDVGQTSRRDKLSIEQLMLTKHKERMTNAALSSDAAGKKIDSKAFQQVNRRLYKIGSNIYDYFQRRAADRHEYSGGSSQIKRITTFISDKLGDTGKDRTTKLSAAFKIARYLNNLETVGLTPREKKAISGGELSTILANVMISQAGDLSSKTKEFCQDSKEDHLYKDRKDQGQLTGKALLKAKLQHYIALKTEDFLIGGSNKHKLKISAAKKMLEQLDSKQVELTSEEKTASRGGRLSQLHQEIMKQELQEQKTSGPGVISSTAKKRTQDKSELGPR